VLAKINATDFNTEWVTGTGGGGGVSNVTGTAPIASSGGATPAISITPATGSFAGSMSASDKSKLNAISGTNTGDQTSIVGLTGTKAQFDTAVTDGNILYVGDVTTSAITDSTVAGRAMLTAATAAAQRTLLNVADGADGATGATGPAGADGADGAAGADGADGATGAAGADGATGAAGADGATGPTGEGVPAGGTTGQVLAKINATDYNTQWVTGGGGSGDVVGPASATDNAVARFDTTTGKLIQNGPVFISDAGQINMPSDGILATPAADTISIFGRKIAGRGYPAFSGPSGLDSALQPFLARNKVGYWNPHGNSNNNPGIFGFTSPTITGFTSTTRNVETINMFSRFRRIGYVSATTAGAVGQWRLIAPQYTIGDGAGVGGFTYIIRFGISDVVEVAGARMFIGMRQSGTPTNVEPSNLTQCVGVGHGEADTNLKIFYGGSVAQTPIDLGVDFPITNGSVEMYELALFAAPNTQTVQYEVTRLLDATSSAGILSGIAGTALPDSTRLIGPWGYRTNNATALAVGLDVASAYIETDF
jgi:hypothetical protein